MLSTVNHLFQKLFFIHSNSAHSCHTDWIVMAYKSVLWTVSKLPRNSCPCADVENASCRKQLFFMLGWNSKIIIIWWFTCANTNTWSSMSSNPVSFCQTTTADWVMFKWIKKNNNLLSAFPYSMLVVSDKKKKTLFLNHFNCRCLISFRVSPRPQPWQKGSFNH